MGFEGWKSLMRDYPWFASEGSYPIPAYSEFMPSPRIGRKAVGETDNALFTDDDLYGIHITEMEEEYELVPGIGHVGQQIMNSIIKLGRGEEAVFIHGHNGENLRGNPYWPEELSSEVGRLYHEKFVILLPMMLSRTQDDKGRIIWTFFGNSINDPEVAFWKNFYISPFKETGTDEAVSFFTCLISQAYKEHISEGRSLYEAGFRILMSDVEKPEWTRQYIMEEDSSPDEVRYLLSFRPFGSLPPEIKRRYLSGKLSIIPFPGSLVFWGMPGYIKLKKELPVTGQIPLLNLVKHNRGLGGLKVIQSGWIHEPRPGKEHKVNEALMNNIIHRTHRWQKLHKYDDELNETPSVVKLVNILFSTEPATIGLYDKPLARNSQIWDHEFHLVLDGPVADRKQILDAERIILDGGLFGYRIFYPPMKVGIHDIYWHRPLIAFLPEKSDKPVIIPKMLTGYFTGYRNNDPEMKEPVELWPRFLNRGPYLSALNDFNNAKDHYNHQTSLNIISLLDSWQMQNQKPLGKSYARSIINIPKQMSLELWLDGLVLHSDTCVAGVEMQKIISGIFLKTDKHELPEPLTYHETATRRFEENWWNDIRFLAHGEFINKDNADVVLDDITLAHVRKKKRDLEDLGDYLMIRHRNAIAGSGMETRAVCGELSFRWNTDFEFPFFGGWKNNQDNFTAERNILVIIPGKNRKEAVILGDHYDTAYMEDIYDHARGGYGARLSANGADDNYSASSTLLQAAPLFLKMSKEGKLERDIWLVHLTGEEFPSDCMGARNLCQSVVEKRLRLKTGEGSFTDLSDITIKGVYIMDMIGHNRDDDQNVFQISPGKSAASLYLAYQAHLANRIWNKFISELNKSAERKHKGKGKRVSGTEKIPGIAAFLHLEGEVRTKYNPHSSIFNTDGQIFSDTGIPVVLLMENYDINRTGYHDTRDTMENIDLDYGAALAAIAIETVAGVATARGTGFRQ
jgi:hypothetical protein